MKMHSNGNMVIKFDAARHLELAALMFYLFPV